MNPPPIPGPVQPQVVVWFRVYAVFLVLLYLLVAAASLFFFFLPESELDMGRREALFVGTLFLVMGLGLALACLPPLVAGPRPWVWVYSLVMICLGMTGCTLPACVPLLIFWIRPEVKAYYGKD